MRTKDTMFPSNKKERIMNKSIQLIFSILAIMSMVISLPQIAFAYEGQLNIVQKK